MRKLIILLLIISIIGCKKSEEVGTIESSSVSTDNNGSEESLESFTREDIVGLWFLRIPQDNTDNYIREIGASYANVNYDGETPIINFNKDGIYDQLIGGVHFTGKWEIENNEVVIWYENGKMFNHLSEEYGPFRNKMTVSLSGFSKDKNRMVKEGMVELLYNHPSRMECNIIQIPIYQKLD